MEYNLEERNKSRDLPGGLVVEFPLTEYPLHEVFTRIVEVDFELKYMEESQRNSAKCLIDGLFEKPKTLPTYVTKQRIYISLSWACDKQQIENLYCQSMILPVHGQENVFQVCIESEFCTQNEIRNSSLLFLENLDIESNKFRGRVVSYDSATSILKFVPIGKRKNKIIENATYRLTVKPSSFVYRSRCRTLTWLLSLNKGDTIFPKGLDDTAISQSDYTKAERDIIPQMKFSHQLNVEQKKAIFGIVSGHHGSLPFILHGPPGTGKTTVLVEAVRMLVADRRRQVRILICTPSNTAADLFISELLNKANIDPKTMFRMYSLKRPVETQNKELRSVMCVCINDNGNEVFGIFSKETFFKFQVVVSTLCASTYLVTGGLNNEFTHIIIDEAGQANEVDTLIPIVGLATDSTKVVMAGDPKQLGPVETLDFINKSGLSVSLLERFSQLQCYQQDRRVICMLEENYRSHPDIIKIPSELFYHNRLFASVAFKQKNALCEWAQLPKKLFPIFWHHVIDNEVRETSGFSYCNKNEINMVVSYVDCILGSLNVQPKDIGVITPYKYQVRMIREALENFPQITVDSVERFQGSERRVIIVSTVRNDKLGFLHDKKRFNTTVMRAEELLIVIGNCLMLSSTSSCWNRFIEFCDSNNGIKDRPEELSSCLAVFKS